MATRARPDTTEPALAAVPSWEPAEAAAEPAQPAVDWRRYLHAIRMRWWLVLAATVVSVVVVGVWTMRQPKLYRSAASLVIDTRTPRVLTGVAEVYDVAASGWVPTNFFETEFEVMRSRAVARAAAQTMRLAYDDRFNGLAGVNDPAARAKAIDALDPADLALGLYTVEPEKRSNIVRVVVVHDDAKFAADLANAVVKAYGAQNLNKRVDETRVASKWLGVQHDDLKAKLRTSEDALLDFMANNDVLNASLDSQLAEVMQRLNAFNAQLAAEEASRIRDTVNMAALKQVREDPALIDTLPEIQAASVVASLKTKRIELKATETELSARYLEDHPKVKLLREQVAAVDADLQREIDAVLVALERQKESREQAITGLREALTAERAKEARLNKLTLDYQRLKRERDSNAQLFDMVSTRMKEADITSALPFNNVRPLDDARVADKPFKPDLGQNLLFALFLGAALGIALALLLEVLDASIKSHEDVEQVLKSPFLGLMPVIGVEGEDRSRGPEGIERLRARDLYLVKNPQSSVAECARFIRTNLLFMTPDRPLRTLVVTSPSPKEGKTTTAVSIGITMAQAGSRTLLVDTDLRKPRLHHVFGVDASVGLSSVLVGEGALAQAIKKTEVDKLDVLPCGPLPPNPAELLLSERFKELVAELAKSYDRVVFDTPPVGPVTDPAILGALVDGVVLVVKCEQTSKDSARQALRALHDARNHVFGVILNDVDVNSARYAGSYSYYYARRYGGYYGEQDDQAKPKKSAEPAA